MKVYNGIDDSFILNSLNCFLRSSYPILKDKALEFYFQFVHILFLSLMKLESRRLIFEFSMTLSASSEIADLGHIRIYSRREHSSPF